MKFLLSLLLVASPFIAFSQVAEQKISLQGANALHVYADMSGLFITTANTDVVSVRHVLLVEGEDRPELKELEIIRDGDQLKILERNPTRDILEKEFGKRGLSVMHNQRNEPPGDYRGTQIVAYLEITVPLGMKVTAESLYGGIEAREMMDMPMAKSKYGTIEVVFAANARVSGLDYESEYQAVDVTIPASTKADLQLRTSFGSMYTDFDFPVKANMKDSRDHGVKSQPLDGSLNGGGAPITLRAKYQNIYLRKR